MENKMKRLFFSALHLDFHFEIKTAESCPSGRKLGSVCFHGKGNYSGFCEMFCNTKCGANSAAICNLLHCFSFSLFVSHIRHLVSDDGISLNRFDCQLGILSIGRPSGRWRLSKGLRKVSQCQNVVVGCLHHRAVRLWYQRLQSLIHLVAAQASDPAGVAESRREVPQIRKFSPA